MTVKELRRILRGVPENAMVLFADHDHGAGMLNGAVKGGEHIAPASPDYIGQVAEYGGGEPVILLHG